MPDYIPNTSAEQQEMLQSMGYQSMDELFEQLPEEVRFQRELDLPDGLSEIQMAAYMKKLAAKNVAYTTSFRGAGAYRHFIPSVVKHIVSRGEFVTAYTPYQAEMSQGVLQGIYEYQTMICSLTGMDASNASVYDGSTALAEAVMMCTGGKRNKVLVSEGVHPQHMEVLETWCRFCGVELATIPLTDHKTPVDTLESLLDEETGAVVLQNPNYFGTLENMEQAGEIIHANKSKFIASVNPISLAVLPCPGEYGADVAVGEGQPLGNALAAGGPYLGFMASTSKMMRKLPGRIVGETQDDKGQRGFVLTLQAREQHIRREKASSNICSNQALNALTAAVYLSAMGDEGLQEAALTSMAQAHKLYDALIQLDCVSGYDQEFFNEFIVKIDAEPDALMAALASQDILGGLPLGDRCYLWCATEMNTNDEIARVCQTIEEVCNG